MLMENTFASNMAVVFTQDVFCNAEYIGLKCRFIRVILPYFAESRRTPLEPNRPIMNDCRYDSQDSPL